MAATDHNDSLVAIEAPRFSRRARITTVVLVAALVLGALWWWASVPRLGAAEAILPVTGLTETVVLDDRTVWQQDGDVGTLLVSVRNDGALPATLSATRPDESAWAGPRLRVAFAPADERLLAPASTSWADLDQSVTIPAGGRAWVVVSTLYPSQCQPKAGAESSAWYTFRSVELSASTLGRASSYDLPLDVEVYVPKTSGTSCPLEDFTSLDAAYPLP
jgi:hypothetical protein